MVSISVSPCRRMPTSDVARPHRRSRLMESWPHSLALLPAAFHSDRDDLLGMMRKGAILYESPTQPILSRDGSTARWMLNSLQVTLTPRGSELAGRCVL